MYEPGQNAVRHLDFRKINAQPRQFLERLSPVFRSQALLALLSFLRRIEAEPDGQDFPAPGPEIRKVPQIVVMLKELTGDGAMNVDSMAGNVLEDAVVSGGCAPPVVVGLQAVDGYGQMKVGQISPGSGNGTDRAGDHLHFHTQAAQLRKQNIQFAIANQWLTAHDREVQRSETAHQRQHARNQGLTLEFTQLAEGPRCAQMLGLISVAAGALQGALPGDFNRQEWPAPAQNAAPSRNDIRFSHINFSTPFLASPMAPLVFLARVTIEPSTLNLAERAHPAVRKNCIQCARILAQRFPDPHWSFPGV